MEERSDSGVRNGNLLPKGQQRFAKVPLCAVRTEVEGSVLGFLDAPWLGVIKTEASYSDHVRCGRHGVKKWNDFESHEKSVESVKFSLKRCLKLMKLKLILTLISLFSH